MIYLDMIGYMLIGVGYAFAAVVFILALIYLGAWIISLLIDNWHHWYDDDSEVSDGSAPRDADKR